MKKRIPLEIREEILRRIKEEGISVSHACDEYGVSESAVYKWLGKTAENKTINPQLEINRLKRENQDLRAMVGHLVYEREKKQRSQGR